MRLDWPTRARTLLSRPVWCALLLQIPAIAAWHTRETGWFLVCATVTALLAVIHARGGRLARFLGLVLFVGVSLALSAAGERRLGAEVTPKSARYAARTADLAVTKDNRTSLLVDLTAREAPVAGPAEGRVKLTIGEPCALPFPSRISFLGSVRPPRAFKDPGVFNYRDHLRQENVWGQAFAARCQDVSVTLDPAAFWWQELRQRLYTRLSSKDLRNGPALTALLLGTRSLGRDEETRIRDAGLSHLFAISGMQFAVMSALIFGFVSFVTRLHPALYLRWPRQKIASAATLAFVTLYLLIVSPQASILRAGLMIATYLIAVLIERQKNLLHVILVSMAILLFFRPLDAFQVSFQLSYLCVLTLALIAGPLIERFKQNAIYASLPRPLSYAFEIALVSWILSVLLLPLILHTFGETSLAGLVHNLWAVPYFDFVVTPLSLVYFILAALLPSLAEPILFAWDGALTLFQIILDRAQTLLQFRLTAFPPHAIHLFVFYGTLFLFARTRRKTVLAAGFALLILTLGRTYYVNRLGFDLRITQIDVVQGDAILVETPDKIALIDAGGSAYFDVAQYVLKPFLRHRWIGRIDTAIITHADTDHYLGFKGLAQDFPIGEVWVSGLPAKDLTYRELIASFHDSGIPIRSKRDFGKETLDSRTFLKGLWPRADAAGEADNDNALVLRIEHGGFSALLTGDIGKKTEERLVELGLLDRVDVLKVAHHGSRSSTTRPFLAATSPRIALIGAGENSRFGHPHPEVLERLDAMAAKIYRTDRDGAITVTVNGTDVRVETFAGE